MPKVRIFTKDYCPYCTMAKKLLESRQIPYEEIHMSQPEEFQELIQRSGMRTVPQIFSDENLIGGYQELSELDQKDHLSSLK